ncbi:MAG TPA: LysR family transcriptional regulator [Caulobacteraceae bacterium]|nr:LysR family transcriptional regulator [Caulobacteraceae bacterium]
MSVVRRKADWGDVRLFWAVAEMGSFGAAARRLGAGLTTVTRAVERLERQLGAKLFVRGPQGVSLTRAGTLAYERARSMERMAEGLEQDLAGIEEALEGRVKLSAPDGVAGMFLAPAAAEFLRSNPKIDLAIDCGLSPKAPLAGEVDLTLTFEVPANLDAIATPLAHFHYAVFASREYLELYGMPTSYEEILQHPYVHHVGQNHRREEVSTRVASFLEFMRWRVDTNSSAVSFATVKYGGGLGAMPTAILALDPSLVMLEAPPLATIKLWLVYHREVAKSARVRCTIDWLKDVFDARTKPWYRPEFIHPRDFAAYLPAEGKTAEASAETSADERRKAAAPAPPPRTVREA